MILGIVAAASLVYGRTPKEKPLATATTPRIVLHVPEPCVQRFNAMTATIREHATATVVCSRAGYRVVHIRLRPNGLGTCVRMALAMHGFNGTIRNLEEVDRDL
jgi:hypothetical protein